MRTPKRYEAHDLAPNQQRAVKALVRAIKTCKATGLGVVADGDSGIRIMREEDLALDDLRDVGFTISVDSTVNMGGSIDLSGFSVRSRRSS